MNINLNICEFKLISCIYACARVEEYIKVLSVKMRCNSKLELDF